ncbi:MAG: phosphoglycerate dehydrogenase [Clostridiales bacterium]|nr:phosphoglycerate dehydrogenase [Clostridiales bacterium]
MYKIKTLNSIQPVWQNILKEDSYCVGNDIQDMDAIIVRSADMHSMEFPESLLCVGRAGAGVNNIPCEELAQKGVVVFNTPGANANAVKELVVLGLLLSGRDVVSGIQWANTLKGQGDAVGKLVEKGKSQFVGPELMGKTLGVIGLGGIGGLVANIAVSLGMKVLGLDPFISVDNAWRLKRDIEHVTKLEDLLAKSDFVTLHIPLTNETKGSFGAEQLAAMKEGAALLNFSRGEIVDTPALLDSLASGHLRRYVTDFPNDALLGCNNVVCIPHLGASTPESENNCVTMVAHEIDSFLTTGSIQHSVNFPECILPPVSGYRLTILHANIPNMVGQITSGVAKFGININSMVNKSKGSNAYSVLELDSPVPDNVIDSLSATPGIFRVRAIG